MSRGLYQLSYGSNGEKYAFILSVWQEKNTAVSRKICAFPGETAPEGRIRGPDAPRRKRRDAAPEGTEHGPEETRRRAGKARDGRDGAATERNDSPAGRKVLRDAPGNPGLTRPGRPALPHLSEKRHCPLFRRKGGSPTAGTVMVAPAGTVPSQRQAFRGPENIRGDERRPGRTREPRGLHAHNRSSGSATRGACRT